MSNISLLPRSIRSYIILVFLILTISVGFAGRNLYEKQKEQLKQSKYDELSAIADLKVQMISWWLQERMDDATVIFETTFIADRVSHWMRNPSDAEAGEEILEWIASLKSGYDYRSVALLDSDGNVILSVPQKEEITPEIPKNFHEVIRKGKPSLSNLYRSETNGQIRMCIGIPLLGDKEDKGPLAVLRLEIDPYKYLYPIIESWPTPSPSSETILMRREGEEALCLSELRYLKNTAVSLRLPLSDLNLLTTKAAFGMEGVVEGIDYRNVPVLAAIRAIPSVSWFIITKYDTEEVFGPFRRYARIIGALVISLIAGAGLIIAVAWRRVERHNTELARLNERLEHEIEERKQTKLALHMSEEKYRGFVESANSIIILTNIEGEITFINKFGQSFFGYSEDDLLGRNAIGIIVPETDSSGRSLATIFHDIVRHPQQYSVNQQENICRDGERVWVAWSNRVIYDSDGNPTGILGIGTDITGQKRAEDALRRNAKLLHILHGIGQSILEVRSLTQTVQEVIRKICELVPWQRAGVAVFDFEANEVILIACHTDGVCKKEDEKHLPLEVFGSIIEVIREGKWYVTEDASDSSLKSDALQALQLEEDLLSFVCVPLSFRNKLIGSFNLWSSTVNPVAPEDRTIISEVANLLAVAIQNARLFESIKEQYKQLRSLIIRLGDVEETEKRRLARELHDRVGQNLTALNINLSILSGMLPRDMMDKVNTRLEDAQGLVKETVRSIRDVMVELRPPDLDEFGLGQSLESYAEKFSERTNIVALVECKEPFPRLSPLVEIALFRIAQEALTNVARHAQATRVVLTLEQLNRETRMTIADNGIGFSTRAFAHPGERKPGWGLLGMRERAEAINGILRIVSAPGRGTSIIVEMEM
jgi:PAS domain S-box-containing protein